MCDLKLQDVGLEITSVSVDISKAFDKVWNDGIIS